MDPLRSFEPSLSGTVVVTGGGNGLGRAAAFACARQGARVAVLDVHAAAANSVANDIRAAHAAIALGIECDVRNEKSVAWAVASAAEQLGPLHGLVTSAGIDRAGLAHELKVDVWQQVLDTNLTGTFLACKHVLAMLLQQRTSGSIVCVSSPWARVSAPGGVGAYCASKGGVSALMRSLALDYASHAIRVNAIVPGAADTGLMWANASPADIPAIRERIGKQLAMGRLAEPDEIAAGITWLLSDQSSYVTGAELVVDGGLMARASIES